MPCQSSLGRSLLWKYARETIVYVMAVHLEWMHRKCTLTSFHNHIQPPNWKTIMFWEWFYNKQAINAIMSFRWLPSISPILFLTIFLVFRSFTGPVSFMIHIWCEYFKWFGTSIEEGRTIKNPNFSCEYEFCSQKFHFCTKIFPSRPVSLGNGRNLPC